MNRTVSTTSLFDRPAASPVIGAADWMGSIATGSLAVILATIAIAIIGFVMLSGRFSLRSGIQVILGTFLLLGAPIIAAAFNGAAREVAEPAEPELPPAQADPREDLPPANYDPYAGASLRRR